MPAWKLSAYINAEHRLEVTLPPDIPMGEAEVVVLVGERAPVSMESLKAFTEKLRQSPSSGRSKEDIDEYIRRERDSWE